MLVCEGVQLLNRRLRASANCHFTAFGTYSLQFFVRPPRGLFYLVQHLPLQRQIFELPESSYFDLTTMTKSELVSWQR